MDFSIFAPNYDNHSGFSFAILTSNPAIQPQRGPARSVSLFLAGAVIGELTLIDKRIAGGFKEGTEPFPPPV